MFDLTDVWAAIATKIVRRHPHVFGESEARTAADVNRQWERIKQGERAAAAEGGTEPPAQRARRHQPVPAGAGGQPGDAGAGGAPRL